MKLMYIPKSKSQQNPPDFIFRSQKPSPHNPDFWIFSFLSWQNLFFQCLECLLLVEEIQKNVTNKVCISSIKLVIYCSAVCHHELPQEDWGHQLCILISIPPSLSTQKIQCKQSNYYLKTWKQLFCVALLHDMYYTINYLNSHDILLQNQSVLIQPWWKNEKK
jgi:hypothetical protein